MRKEKRGLPEEKRQGCGLCLTQGLGQDPGKPWDASRVPSPLQEDAFLEKKEISLSWGQADGKKMRVQQMGSWTPSRSREPRVPFLNRRKPQTQAAEV